MGAVGEKRSCVRVVHTLSLRMNVCLKNGSKPKAMNEELKPRFQNIWKALLSTS